MIRKKFSDIVFILIVLSVVTIASCTTEKNTFVTRTYHNVTAYYNVYFNGNESFKKGIQKLDETYKDNYSRILPVFTYSDDAAAKAVTADMDKSIKKASKLIKYHSIRVKPKMKPDANPSKRKKEFLSKNEYCKWVDDAYLLMGKAHFYKHDYFQARINFEYVISQFKDEEIRFDATLWIARIQLETNQFNKARQTLDMLEVEKKLPRRIKGELAAIYADYYMKQKNYEEAATELRKAIDKTRNRRLKARYKFILAQIYQKLGECKNASNLYAQVIKLNPPYEMAFNAKINRATCFDVSSGDANDIKKQLTKMLKDEKNKEYLDQIYYAIANIYYKENNIEEALANYKLSVQNSSGNNDQKAISHLAIADIYFSRLEYRPSQAYYDSCISLLDRKHPDYEKIYLKTTNLTELVENLNIIEHEDSIQKVARMSEGERIKFIDKLIEKVKEEEARLKEEENQKQMNMMFDQKNDQTNLNQGGKWYFYNPTTLGLGFAEFRKRWGNRKLEDSWRRKNKAIVMSDDMADNSGTGATDSTAGKPLSNKSREYYLKGLPINDSLVAKSNQKIKDSYFKLGKIYKEKLLDINKSIDSYEALNKKFTTNEYQLATYYDLHLSNKQIKNNVRAEFYKSLIITKFADSKYAKLLVNPNYLNELKDAARQLEELYAQTFELYKSGQYEAVIQNCKKSESFAENKLLPQFEFLKAVSVGRTTSNDNLKKMMQELQQKYPDSEISVPVQNILTYLKKGSLSDIKEKIANNKFYVDTTTTTQEAPLYSYNENAPHFYVIIVPNTKKIDYNRLSFNVSNFNIDFYGMANYNVSAVMLNKEFHLITVKSFENKKIAYAYYKLIKDNPDVFKDLEPNDYRQFLISTDNFATLFKEQDVGKYILFFEKKYTD